MKIFITIIVLLLFSTKAIAATDYKPNENDACRAAQEIVAMYSDVLPMKINENITLEKASALKNIVQLTAVLIYSKQELETALSKKGLTFDDMSRQLIGMTRAGTCQENSGTLAFISLGGQIQYDIKYSDGTPLLTIDIKDCEKSINYP